MPIKTCIVSCVFYLCSSSLVTYTHGLSSPHDIQVMYVLPTCTDTDRAPGVDDDSIRAGSRDNAEKRWSRAKGWKNQKDRQRVCVGERIKLIVRGCCSVVRQLNFFNVEKCFIFLAFRFICLVLGPFFLSFSLFRCWCTFDAKVGTSPWPPLL